MMDLMGQPLSVCYFLSVMGGYMKKGMKTQTKKR